MANPNHLNLLREALDKEDISIWNSFREKNKSEIIDLSEADLRMVVLNKIDLSNAILSDVILSGSYLYEANLSRANLSRAYLPNAKLLEANLSKTNLSGAHLTGADFFEANLSGADFTGAEMYEVSLSRANLSKANLSKAALSGARFIKTKMDRCILNDSNIYGISVWDIEGVLAEQKNLVITPEEEPEVTVDDIKVAQFIYLLLNNPQIRNVIESIGKKGVLILGRFTPERKQILNSIREKLRDLNFVPMMFDFEKAESKDFTETIKILAGLSRFVIVDITQPKSAPLELQATIPDYMIPFVPIIEKGEKPFSMFKDLDIKYSKWVLPTLPYDSLKNLMEKFKEAIIHPALAVENNLLIEKAREEVRMRTLDDYSKDLD